jgi:hypothetical protein
MRAARPCSSSYAKRIVRDARLISFGSIVGQLFPGIDAELCSPSHFFLLVGELMPATNATHRMIAVA